MEMSLKRRLNAFRFLTYHQLNQAAILEFRGAKLNGLERRVRSTQIVEISVLEVAAVA